MIETLKLKITAKVDERMFHAGDSIELNLTAGVVNYMVGSNGCGKSTLLHAIRSYKDSIYDLLLYKDKFDVDGLDQFEHVFTLDAVEDNPVSFEKAASATALIDGGGYWFMRRSRGEGSKMLLSRFISNMQKITGASIDNEAKKPANIPKTRSLIIIDEMDEGLDMESQSTFPRLLFNLCVAFNATVLCVCHNPTCILFDKIGTINPVFDMSDRTYKGIHQYINEQSGKYIITMTPEEYSEYITWKTYKNNTK